MMRGMGRIFQRGRIWWIAYYHRGHEIRESSGSTEPAAARNRLRERLRTAGTPAFIKPEVERLTLEHLGARLLTDYRINGRRSVRDAARNVRRLTKAFANSRALDVTSDDVAAYIETRLDDGVSRATVSRELATLRRMYVLAVKSKKLPSRPYVPTLEEDPPREGFFEAAEFAAVSAALPPDYADTATFAYLAGWRKGEIQSLEWRDVDLQAGVTRLRSERSKNRRGRVLVLRGELLSVIRRRANVRRLDCPYVFHTNGRPIGDIRKSWRNACAAAGVTGRLFHDLRRTAIRNMIRAGVPERVAMDISGHRTRNVFDRYNIVSEDDLGNAIERTLHYVDRERRRPPRITPIHLASESG